MAKRFFPLIILCGLLGSGVSAIAGDDQRCSNRTLSGDYGYASEGVLLDVPGLPSTAQFRSVGMTHFDGRGNLTWVEHTVIHGVPQTPYWTAASGTYTVNPNCTGSAVVNTPHSFQPLTLTFVIVNHGREVHSVLDVGAVSTVFTKVD